MTGSPTTPPPSLTESSTRSPATPGMPTPHDPGTLRADSRTHGRDGTSARMTMLADFSAAQPTSIHRRIMLARGVIVPQRQTLRAVTFPAAVVGEKLSHASNHCCFT